MQSLVFELGIPKYLLAKATGRYYGGIFSPLKLRELPEPQLTKPHWAKIKTTYGGICGSDLGVILLKLSPALTPFSSFPTVLGHEIVGRIVEIKAPESDLKIGERKDI